MKETKYSLKKLEDAFLKLKSGAAEADSELAEDGVIQRFEFTFEMFWNALMVFLRKKGIDAKTPRDVLKEAFRIEWLNEEEVFLNMLEDRNKTSHIYNKEVSREIFNRIKNKYVPAVEEVLNNLRNLI